jgi:serine/threonine protein kinase
MTEINKSDYVPDMAFPSQYSRPASLELNEAGAVFRGYQEFLLTRYLIEPYDSGLQSKKAILSKYFNPSHLKSKTVLDIGANAGFFCFWSLQNGAEKATAVEIDPEYIKMARDAASHLGFANFEIVNENIANWHNSADFVVALSLIHWIFSCSAQFGSLSKVIEKLSSLTNYILITEWIEPDDPAILSAGHLEWNRDSISGSYSREEFEKALGKYFAKFEVLGNTQDTRIIYAAYKTAHEIDLSGPLPLLMDKKFLVSSKLLGNVGSISYWSQVYDPQNGQIYKHASFDLAVREKDFLVKLDGGYFPKVVSVEVRDASSILIIEKINGIPLATAVEQINSSVDILYTFIFHCLKLLDQLKQNDIVHRDIHIENVIFCDDKPFLIDFGWAVTPNDNIIAPAGLHQEPSGGSCDVYSLGKVLESVVQEKYPEVRNFLRLMTESYRQARITDISLLKEILLTMAQKSSDKIELTPGVFPNPSNSYNNLVVPILKQVSLKYQLSVQNQKLQESINILQQQLNAQENTINGMLANNSELKDKYLNLSIKNTELETTNASIMKMNAELETKNKNLTIINTELEVKNSNLAATNIDLAQKYTELEQSRTVHLIRRIKNGFKFLK